MQSNRDQRVVVEGKGFQLLGKPFFLRGVSYGPFAPRNDGHELPPPDVVLFDLKAIREAGGNTVRLHVPPPMDFLDQCQQEGLQALVTLPWTQHVDFLNQRRVRREIIESVRRMISGMAGHPAILGYLVGNEIASPMVRWLGPERVRHFLEELIRVGRHEDPGALFSYATYPPTEYLIPDGVDFYCSNVYLHETAALEHYLRRIQNLAGDLPVVLGEFGMDTHRHGEEAQADLIRWQVPVAVRCGLAGVCLFAWTDDWFRNGAPVEDWAFGVTTRDRKPKAGREALRDSFTTAKISRQIPGTPPKVSVIVCAYNAAHTLGECLAALTNLDYPDYEVVIVDDGSTDATASMARKFPAFRLVTVPHGGLGAARNAGATAATGEIFAYTDADCIPDPDWLWFLLERFSTGAFEAVGGPNIPPGAINRTQAAVAAAPGGPVHVLFNDTEAEHIPGCNLAVTRRAFEEIGGFDTRFHAAGDDVDFCWRLLLARHKIGFSPGAVVRHYRRFTPGAYLRQQAGYGKAESILRAKHLAAFTPGGGACWKGRIYPARPRTPGPGMGLIYFGTFGNAPWQSVYSSGSGDASALVAGPEWFATGLLVMLLAFLHPLFLVPAGFLLGAPLIRAARSTLRQGLPPAWDGPYSRTLLFSMTLVQPWIRSLSRYQAWMTLRPVRSSTSSLASEPSASSRRAARCYWSEEGVDRDRFLEILPDVLEERGLHAMTDPGWALWDLQLHHGWFWKANLLTVTEYHGGPKCLTRVRVGLRPRMATLLGAMLLATLATLILATGMLPWWSLFPILLIPAAGLSYKAARLRKAVLQGVGEGAARLGLTPMDSSSKANSL